MKTLGFAWGVGGILLLLVYAIMRLGPMALELASFELHNTHWIALAFSILYMAYAEGYKGFHRAFAPRVVARANYLSLNPKPVHVALAPVFCMGYIFATRRRKLLSFGLSAMILSFVLIVRLLPQPWRGIVDAGVVTGLMFGIFSIAYYLVQLMWFPERPQVDVEIPESHRLDYTPDV
ncbi:MAG: hypothetical protein R3332_06240 [Pseudohongiellaceae bacterium]|nr:hypothetical protein [Pseudohongiellaceae bacterium]